MRVAVLLGCNPREFPHRYVHVVVSSVGAGDWAGSGSLLLRSTEVQYVSDVFFSVADRQTGKGSSPSFWDWSSRVVRLISALLGIRNSSFK